MALATIYTVMERDKKPDWDEFLLAKEVAAWLRTGLSTIYEWADRNQIPHVRINGLLRFSKAEVAAWLHNRVKAPQSQRLPKDSNKTVNPMAVTNSVLKQTARRVRTRALRFRQDMAT